MTVLMECKKISKEYKEDLMLSKICNKVLAFENYKINRYEYGFDRYLNKEETTSFSSEYDKALLENRISYVLSKLSLAVQGTDEYKKLDKEFNSLIKIRKDN